MDEKEPSDALVEDPEAVDEPFVENLEAKSRETYYQIDCRTAGGAEVILEADAESNCLLKLYLRLVAKKLTKLYLRLAPNKLMKLSN